MLGVGVALGNAGFETGDRGGPVFLLEGRGGLLIGGAAGLRRSTGGEAARQTGFVGAGIGRYAGQIEFAGARREA